MLNTSTLLWATYGVARWRIYVCLISMSCCNIYRLLDHIILFDINSLVLSLHNNRYVNEGITNVNYSMNKDGKMRRTIRVLTPHVQVLVEIINLYKMQSLFKGSKPSSTWMCGRVLLHIYSYHR